MYNKVKKNSLCLGSERRNVPSCGTERVKWTTGSSTGRRMVKRGNTPQKAETWSDLINKTSNGAERKHIGANKAFNYSITTKMNTKRTISPQTDYTYQPREGIKCFKRKFLGGSLTDLVNKKEPSRNNSGIRTFRTILKNETEEAIKNSYSMRKFRNPSGDLSIITRSKKKVDLEKYKNDITYAGGTKKVPCSKSTGKRKMALFPVSRNENIARKLMLKYSASSIFVFD